MLGWHSIQIHLGQYSKLVILEWLVSRHLTIGMIFKSHMMSFDTESSYSNAANTSVHAIFTDLYPAYVININEVMSSVF